MNITTKNINRTILPASSFTVWLRNVRKALTGNRVMNVPCGTCDACCRSSYFIHINPEETKTLSRIQNKFIFPAPLRPDGHMVLGYDAQGRCPMMAGNYCSIYRNRPATCRMFDCRVLAASGLADSGNGNNPIFQQARRWQFSYSTKRDLNLHLAVQAAAAFLIKHPFCVQTNLVPMDAIQISVAAVKVYTVFLKANIPPVDARTVNRESDLVNEVVNSYKKFEKQIQAA